MYYANLQLNSKHKHKQHKLIQLYYRISQTKTFSLLENQLSKPKKYDDDNDDEIYYTCRAKIFACRMFIKSLSSKSVLLSVLCYEQTYCGVLSVFAQSWSITASSKVTRTLHIVSLRHIFADLRYRDQNGNQGVPTALYFGHRITELGEGGGKLKV